MQFLILYTDFLSVFILVVIIGWLIIFMAYQPL